MKELTLERNLMDMGNVQKHSHIHAGFIGLIQERMSMDISNVGKTFLLPVILRNMNKVTLGHKYRKARWESIHLFHYHESPHCRQNL
jgi:hypothetical protein